jgi:putative transcriptional regulator
MANYHPNDELLMTYSAGQVNNALGIMLACHLEVCSQCRAKVHKYNQLGGEILSSTTPITVSSGLKQRVLAQLEQPRDTNTNPIIDAPLPPSDQRIPRPLWRFVPSTLNDIAWKGFTSSIQEFTLPFSDDTYTAKFYKIAAGKELPEHTHKGNEFTLVLDGAFSDQVGSYHQGDFILANTETIHTPHAHKDKDCICFAVLDAPLKMTGFFGRMLNPFLR